jgi:hypothetical protein
VIAQAAAAALTLHVRGNPRRTTRPGCVFVIANPLVEGGSQTTCLTSVDGFPQPDGVIRSKAKMTFALKRGTIRVAATIVMRFGADGVHARQTVSGRIVGGTRAYRGARGTIAGGGTVADHRTSLGPVSLTYRLAVRA